MPICHSKIYHEDMNPIFFWDELLGDSFAVQKTILVRKKKHSQKLACHAIWYSKSDK